MSRQEDARAQLLLTFDVNAEADFIILKKILSYKYLTTGNISFRIRALDQVPFLILPFRIR
jgi:hypothetical protein